MAPMKRWNIAWLGLLLGALLASAACDPESPPRSSESRATPAPAGPRFVYAPAQGEVAALVEQALGRAHEQDQELIVYVSAAWCEPCRHFEHAVESGTLRDAFPRLQIFKFDLDRDRDRLARAGYSSEMIPLFVIPSANGRASARAMQGSIKGADSVATNIVPRLRQLLGR